MPKTPGEISDLFRYHPPTEAGAETHGHLSSLFEGIAREIELSIPDGREKAIVYTKLEEAKMWASAAVARNPATR